MKRRITRILICLLLGVVLNIAMAWIAVYRADSLAFDPQVTAAVRRAAAEQFADDVEQMPWLHEAMVSHGVRVLLYQDETGGPMFRWEAGWPVRSMVGFDVYPAETGFEPTAQWAIRLERKLYTTWTSYTGSKPTVIKARQIHRMLPIQPLWPGFIYGALFYAVVLLALYLITRSAQMIVRRARRKCTRCGYNLMNSSGRGCPECGWRRTAPVAE